MSPDCVVDASVGIKLFLVELLADQADALFASLALEHGLTAYGAAYVALARGLSLPLVTADEALVRRLEHTGLDVRWLGEWPA